MPEKDQRKSAAWTTWPNLAYQFKLVITGWDSAVVDIAFCKAFASTKISSSQWKHLSTLIVKGLLDLRPWSDGKSAVIIFSYMCMSCFFRGKTYPRESSLLWWHPRSCELWRSCHGLCQRLDQMGTRQLLNASDSKETWSERWWYIFNWFFPSISSILDEKALIWHSHVPPWGTSGS